MKQIYLLLALFFFQEALGQITTITGKVIDKSNQKPLAYVNLYLAGTSVGTVTNQSGNFLLKYPLAAKSDTLVFSYLGYKPLRLSLKNAAPTALTVALEPQSLVIKEVVIKPQEALDVVYQFLTKIPQNYNFKSHTVQGFQRESVKQAGNYIQLLEAAFETRSRGAADAPVSRVLEARYIEDKNEKAPLWNPAKGGFYTFGWTPVSGIENPGEDYFLGVRIEKKSDLTRYYEFQLQEPIRSDNQELYVIAFDQKKNVKRPLLKGTLYIDSKSDALVKLSYELSPRGINYLKAHQTWGNQKVSNSPKKITIRKDQGEITYKKHGSKWYLSSLVLDTEFDASLVFLGMVQAQKNALRLHSEKVVTLIDTLARSSNNTTANIQDIGSIPTLQNFIKKNFENYAPVEDEKWSAFNFIQADTPIVAIAKQLQLRNQQWETERKQQVLEKAITRSNYTKRQLTEDVDFLQETLEKVHPGLYWYTNKPNLDAEFAQVKSRLKKKNTEAGFFQLLSPVIEKIHCGHTDLSPSIARAEYQQRYRKLFPLNLWIKGNNATITTPYDNIRPGSQLLSINGYPMPEVITRLKSVTASDGFNLTYKEFLLNQKFPQLWAEHFSSADTFEVKIQDLSGQVQSLKVAGKTPSQLESKKAEEAKLLLYDSLQTAKLIIPSFAPEQDFAAFLQQSFQQITRKGIKNLILDLRNNQGGRDEYGLLLFSYLARQPFQYYRNISVATRDTLVLNRLYFGEVPFTSAIPDYLSKVKPGNGAYHYTAHANLGVHQPQPDAFTGAVYILINGGTFSSAADFAAVAHANQRAIFVGEETGGGYYGNCSLGTPTLTLPHSQIRLTVPLAKYETAVAESVPAGQGVLPNHPMRYNVPDVLANKDKELELCFRLIRETGK